MILLWEKNKNWIEVLLLQGLSCLTNNNLRAQLNFIPNPSFEMKAECPRYFSALKEEGNSEEVLKDWTRPTAGTTDYFHACAAEFDSLLGVPNNFSGYIPAFDGVAYCGFYTFSGPDTSSNFYNYREYLQARLLFPLMAGSAYCFSFYIRPASRHVGRAQGDEDIVFFATHQIGAYFSVNPIREYTYPQSLNNLPVQPQISAATMVDDTTGWTSVRGIYIAEGGEKWITIGNFYSDTLTRPLVELWDGGGERRSLISYYFIDQVYMYQLDNIPTVSLNNGAYAICGQLPTEIQASDKLDSWLWSTGDTTMTITAQTEGIYWLKTSFQGCPITDTFSVKGYEPPTVDLGPDIDLCQAGQIQATVLRNAVSLDNYRWSTGLVYDSIVVAQPGIYRLTTEHVCGSISDEVEAFDCTSTIYIPNVITPESSDANAVFLPSGRNVEVLLLEVYNVWGHRVFQAAQPGIGWDGRTGSGSYVQPGVYTYRLRYRNTLDNVEIQRIGDVTVIR